MRVGTYIFFGLLLIGAVGGGVYLLHPGYYSLTVMGITLNLPIAAWVTLPMALLYLMTILHMGYHGTREYFRRRKLIHDAEEVKDALYWSLLQEPKIHHYATQQMRESAPLLNVSRVEVLGSVQGLSDKLMKALEWVKKIENGEYVDLKSKKVERFLSKENPLVIRNQLNRLEQEKDFAEEVLQSRSQFDGTVVRKALEIFVRKESLYKLKKYAGLLEKKDLYTLLDRVDVKEDIGFSPEMLSAFVEEMELECRDYMRLAKTTLKRFTPDENLELFKGWAKKTEKAQNAYLYLLFEYEMLDGVKHFLEEHDEREFLPFRAFFVLKRGKYHFKIDDLLDSDIACR